ncbi:MAG: hypothetical protein AAGC58_04535 [Asticcacaulis sp.]
MKLISNWRQGWRFVSTQAMALSLAISGAWLALPDDWRTRVPDDLVALVTVPVLLIGIVGRFMPQGEGTDATE